jgi:hypothetical protein
LKGSRTGRGRLRSPSRSSAIASTRSLGARSLGTVHNTFTEEKTDLQLRVAGFVDGELATGDFTYVDRVFPEKRTRPSRSSCSVTRSAPPELDEIGVYPNLGEDKIFNSVSDSYQRKSMRRRSLSSPTLGRRKAARLKRADCGSVRKVRIEL